MGDDDLKKLKQWVRLSRLHLEVRQRAIVRRILWEFVVDVAKGLLKARGK